MCKGAKHIENHDVFNFVVCLPCDFTSSHKGGLVTGYWPTAQPHQIVPLNR